jgi:U3 small nucleolar RNA-associated protein 4
VWALIWPVEVLLGGRGYSEDSVRNHKMVARILLQGDANITSASISRDGRFLVVATAAEIKAFKLSRTGDTVRVAKVEKIPSQWRRGASAVRISPDCRWVCAIQAGSKVTVARVGKDSLGDSSCQFDDNARALKRFRRSNGQQHLTALGLYDQNITHVAFAPDSRLLAVADLSGFIETWILKTDDNAARNGRADDSSASSNEDSDAEKVGATDEAWWQTNPRARLLPRLPAAPAVLSFSELLPSTDDDYTLLAVTTSMQLICLSPVLGSMTDWSRRNPASRLPDELRLNRDVLKGAIWQGSRVWLYGVSSLFMLDLSMDFSDEARDSKAQTSSQPLGKKRKREKNSGAGEKMARGLIGPRQVQSMNGEAAKPQLEDVRTTNGGKEAQNEEDDFEDDQAILKLRELQNNQSEVLADGGRQSFWCTYKYRPILGIVPLDSQNLAMAADRISPGSASVELAVVERPSWDVDLPLRYLGKTEYER